MHYMVTAGPQLNKGLHAMINEQFCFLQVMKSTTTAFTIRHENISMHFMCFPFDRGVFRGINGLNTCAWFKLSCSILFTTHSCAVQK